MPFDGYRGAMRLGFPPWNLYGASFGLVKGIFVPSCTPSCPLFGEGDFTSHPCTVICYVIFSWEIQGTDIRKIQDRMLAEVMRFPGLHLTFFSCVFFFEKPPKGLWELVEWPWTCLNLVEPSSDRTVHAISHNNARSNPLVHISPQFVRSTADFHHNSQGYWLCGRAKGMAAARAQWLLFHWLCLRGRVHVVSGYQKTCQRSVQCFLKRLSWGHEGLRGQKGFFWGH